MADMKLATLAGDKTVKALAARLVSEKVVARPADPAALEKAILAANPHLHDIAKLPPGTPVVIPSAPEAPPLPAESNALIHAAMDGLRKTMAEGRALYANGAEVAKAKQAALQSPEVQKAIVDLRAKDPALAQKVTVLADASKARLTAITTAATARDTAIAKVQTVLAGNVRPSSPR